MIITLGKHHSEVASELKQFGFFIQTKRMSHQWESFSKVLLLLGLAMCALEAAAGGGSHSGCARRQAVANTTRVALITDSGSPIGLATAKMLARKGYSLAMVGASRPQLEQALKECSEASVGVATEVSFVGQNNLSTNPPLGDLKLTNARAHNARQPFGMLIDLTSNPELGAEAVRLTLRHFGRLDVLIINSGATWPTSMRFAPESFGEYRRVMSANMDASVAITINAAAALNETCGDLIFTLSVAADEAPLAENYAYSVSQATVGMFAKNALVDLAPRVRVNVVKVGPILTADLKKTLGLSESQLASALKGTNLLGELGTTEDVANAVGFLLSPEASFVNGLELYVDGGYTLKPSKYFEDDPENEIIAVRERQFLG